MCTILSDQSHFPVIITISERNDESTASGTIQWPTLNAKTKFKATIKEDLFKVNEYEATAGEEEVDLPNDYELVNNGDTMTGKLITDDPEAESTLALTKLPTPASSDYDCVKPKAILKGVVSYDFDFEIETRTGVNITGTITWPTLGNAKTKVKGKIEGEELTFEEFETESENVAVPVSYIGNVANAQVTGQFHGEGNQGGFQLNLK